MKCCKLLFILLLLSKISIAQDFIVLKKNSHVIQTWFSGQQIFAQLNNGDWVNAIIKNIKIDTLYLRPFALQIVANRFGMPITDTVFYGLMKVGVSNLHAFPKKESMPYVKNGSILQLGAGGYLLLNVINTLSNNEPVFGSEKYFSCWNCRCCIRHRHCYTCNT